MEAAKSCLGFAVDCGTIVKGVGVTVMGLILFVGSVYLLLTAVFGRWMGFLVLMVCFSGWMILQSSLWLFGFWSQGIETPTNLGPRDRSPRGSCSRPRTPRRPRRTTSSGPTRTTRGPCRPPRPKATRPRSRAQAQVVPGGAAERRSSSSLPRTRTRSSRPPFLVDDVRFAEAADGTQLAVARAHYTGGGPQWTVSM